MYSNLYIMWESRKIMILLQKFCISEEDTWLKKSIWDPVWNADASDTKSNGKARP